MCHNSVHIFHAHAPFLHFPLTGIYLQIFGKSTQPTLRWTILWLAVINCDSIFLVCLSQFIAHAQHLHDCTEIHSAQGGHRAITTAFFLRHLLVADNVFPRNLSRERVSTYHNKEFDNWIRHVFNYTSPSARTKTTINANYKTPK